MIAIHQRNRGFAFRPFMIEHQYKVMFVSIVVGLLWVGIYHWLASAWFLSRLSVLMAIISFVPAGLVVLAHFRESGPFFWWDKNNEVFTTRRPRNLERVEFVVMTALWAVIFGFVIVVIFVLSR